MVSGNSSWAATSITIKLRLSHRSVHVSRRSQNNTYVDAPRIIATSVIALQVLSWEGVDDGERS